MTADKVDVHSSSIPSAEVKVLIWKQTKKDVHLDLAMIQIENSKAIMLIYTGLSEDSGETDMK